MGLPNSRTICVGKRPTYVCAMAQYGRTSRIRYSWLEIGVLVQSREREANAQLGALHTLHRKLVSLPCVIEPCCVPWKLTLPIRPILTAQYPLISAEMGLRMPPWDGWPISCRFTISSRLSIYNWSGCQRHRASLPGLLQCITTRAQMPRLQRVLLEWQAMQALSLRKYRSRPVTRSQRLHWLHGYHGSLSMHLILLRARREVLWSVSLRAPCRLLPAESWWGHYGFPMR